MLIYADDIILLSPGRSSMEKMLELSEAYASDHNLDFMWTQTQPSQRPNAAMGPQSSNNNATQREAQIEA